jgi:hypothetical protein
MSLIKIIVIVVVVVVVVVVVREETALHITKLLDIC